MSSKSDECGYRERGSSGITASPAVASIVSQATQTHATGHAVGPLLEQNNATRVEILALENALCEKYAELMVLQTEPQPGANSTPSFGYHYKLQRAVTVIDELERFSREDCLNEDAIDEYIRYLVHMYTQVPIIGPDAVQIICYSPLERARQYLESRQVLDSAKILFVVKDADRYSLILYVASDAAFYHYDVIGERSETAQQLMFTLMQWLKVTRFVDVDENSVYTDSGLFCIDNVMKLLLRSEEERTPSTPPLTTMTTTGAEEDTSQSQNLSRSQSQSQSLSQSRPQSPALPPVTPAQQFMQMHSHPDYLKIIIMSRYIVTKLSQMEKLCSGGVRQSWSSSP